MKQYNKLRESYKEIYTHLNKNGRGISARRSKPNLGKCNIDYNMFFCSDSSSSDEEEIPNTNESTHKEETASSLKYINNYNFKKRRYSVDKLKNILNK